MKKLFLVPFAAAALAGCWFMGQPKALVIVTDQARAKSLMTALQLQVTDLKESEVVVKVVGKNSTEEVLKCLDWAEKKGIKTIGIDGDSYEPGDPKVAPKLKALNAAGFYVAGVEFA